MRLKACKICILLCLERTVERGCHLEYSIHSKELGSILLTIDSLYPELQSSYRQHHSTETALLKVLNDVLLNMNSQQVTLMVLLDLSMAFDTVNHDVMLERLDKDIGMRSVMLAHISLINANTSVLMDLCLTVVHLRGPVLVLHYLLCTLLPCSRLLNVISPRLIVTLMIPSYTWVSSRMMLTPRMRFVCWIHGIHVDRSCIRIGKVVDWKIIIQIHVDRACEKRQMFTIHLYGGE